MASHVCRRLSRRFAALPALLLVLLCAAGCESRGEAEYERGKSLQDRGMESEAISAYELAITYYTEDKITGKNPARAHDRLGSIYKDRREYPKAIEHLEAAITQFPDSFGRHAKLMRAYAQNGQFDKAREVYDKVSANKELRFHLKDKQKIEEAKATNDQEEAAAKKAAESAPAPAAADAPNDAPSDGADTKPAATPGS